MGRIVADRGWEEVVAKSITYEQSCTIACIVFKSRFCLTVTEELRISKETVDQSSADHNAPTTPVENLLLKAEHLVPFNWRR